MRPDFHLDLAQNLNLIRIERGMSLRSKIQPILFRRKIAAVIRASAVLPQPVKRFEVHIEHFRHAPELWYRWATSQHLTVIQNYCFDLWRTVIRTSRHRSLHG